MMLNCTMLCIMFYCMIFYSMLFFCRLFNFIMLYCTPFYCLVYYNILFYCKCLLYAFPLYNVLQYNFFCLFNLIFYVPSTIFQLKRDESSWVEPVLSWDKCVLLNDHNAVKPVRLEPPAPWFESSTLPLSNCALVQFLTI